MRNIFILCILALLSCNRFESDIIFRHVDPLDKILPESALFMPSGGQADVARGENATYQFVVRCNQNITNLKVNISDFSSVETAKNISLHKNVSFVGNVHVGRPQASPAKDILLSPSNFYPDPLLNDRSIHVAANTSQAIWISIPIPTDCSPGNYIAEIEIEGKVGKQPFKKEDRLSLKIYSTTIEQQTLLITNWYQPGFNCVDGEDIPQFSERWWELMNQMADYMKEYRQNVVLISPLTLADYKFTGGRVESIRFERFDEVVSFFIKKGILKKIAGGHIAGRFGGWESDFGYLLPTEENGKTIFKKVSCNDEEAKRFYKKFFTELFKHLEEKRWAEMYIQHIADEPVKSNAPSYIAIASYIKSLCSGLKLIDACHTKDLDNQIDIWIPQLNYLHTDFEFYQSQQKKGKEVWYYTCVWPQGEYANRYIQQPLIKTRLLHWINYKYDINGYLHWGLNFWRGPDPMTETAAIQPDGLVLPGGDAWVLYPYKKHLIPSIRLEAMRDGIVDYELLKLLEKTDKEEADRIVDKLIYNFNKYDTDILHFRTVRKSLLEALESAYK